MVSSWRTWAGGAHACLPSRTRPSAAACTGGRVGRAGNGGRDGERTTRSWSRVSALSCPRLASSPGPGPDPNLSDPGDPSTWSRHLLPSLCPCLCLCCSCEAANPGRRLRTRANHRAWAPGAGLASSSYSWSSWGSRGTRVSPFVHSAHVSPDAAAFEKVSKDGQAWASGRCKGKGKSASASAQVLMSRCWHEGRGARGHSSTGRSEHGRAGRLGGGEHQQHQHQQHQQ